MTDMANGKSRVWRWASCMGWLGCATACLGACRSQDASDQIVALTLEMTEIIRDNLADCDGVVKKLESFRESRKAQLQTLDQSIQKLESSADASANEAAVRQTLQRIEKRLAGSISTFLLYTENCPEHATKLTELMNLFPKEGADETTAPSVP